MVLYSRDMSYSQGERRQSGKAERDRGGDLGFNLACCIVRRSVRIRPKRSSCWTDCYHFGISSYLLVLVHVSYDTIAHPA
jgi:hypothetical protein